MSKPSAASVLQELNGKALTGNLDVLAFLADNFILENGRPISLEPWQREKVLEPVFVKDESGRRRFDTYLCGIAKKNGKSTLASLLGVGALLLDDPAPEVYSAAGDKDQAKIIFRMVKKAFERSAGLRPFVRIYSDTIERVDGAGFYKVLSADAPTTHGLNASCVIWDELWNQPSYDLWEALTHSPTRANPFHFVVSYAGYQARKGNLLWDLYSRGRAGDDSRMYMFWLDGDDANPATWVTQEYLDRQRRRLPDHIFRRLHRNEWSVAEETKVFRVPQECWQGSFENPIDSGTYVAGIDLAKSRDFTAWAILRTDVQPARLVDFGKLPHIDYTAQVQILAGKMHSFQNPTALVDAGAAGTAVIELMRQSKMNVEEFSFTSERKAKIVTDLAVDFEQKAVVLPGDGRTIDEKRFVNDLEAELFNFEPTVLRSGNIRYEAGSGYHDDLIMALCLSHEMQMRQREVREPMMTCVSLDENEGPLVDRYANLPVNDPGPERWWHKLN